jgi:D-alanine-D-alanine ligase
MDEGDVLVQAAAVAGTLEEQGYEPLLKACSLNLADVVALLRRERPAFVFNLVETIDGRGSLIHLVPSLLDALEIPYTGAGTEAIFLSSNKILAKKLLSSGGVATPVWHTLQERPENPFAAGPYIIKSVWEHASIGLDEDALIQVLRWEQLRGAIADRSKRLEGPCFAEAFIDGREFNLSLLAGEDGSEVLPPAEIRFDDYPPGRVRMVGYEAKWIEGSFPYQHTPRCFDFRPVDDPLLETLSKLARRCWRLFGLRGYARVDFRVDRAGVPWVLEVNTNPCLSPDAGFAAAAQRRGLRFREIIERILRDIPAAGRSRDQIP